MNDMRLIDADVLYQEFEKAAWYNNADRDEIAEFLLLDAPAIGAVPVVRCKACKWYHDFETHYDCANGYGIDYPKPDDFCSYGERKDGDG